MTDSSELLSAILANRQPLEPITTNVSPQLEKLADLRAVIFDVYGTLVVSGSGDVGVADENDRGSQVGDAMAAIGWFPPVGDVPGYGDLLRQEIAETNARHVSEICPKPEVDIVDIWRKTLMRAGLDYLIQSSTSVVRLAAEYESRANPTWPMPGASDLLAKLQAADLPLGIVSNAQVFTIPLVESLSGGPLAKNGFDLNLCVFSNRFRQAKPGPRLFQVLCKGLERRGISPEQAIYVGNDMLNDVWAASQAGLKTAWFAGDRRSCRPRENDSRCQSIRPNIILTDLLQLLECIGIE